MAVKSKKYVAAAVILAAMLSLCGCDGETYKKTSVKSVVESFERDCEELKKTEFTNLSFEDAEFSFPDIEYVSELSKLRLDEKTVDELYEFFSKSVDTLLPGVFSDEEKANEIRFIDARLTYGEDEINPPYPYNCANYEQYINGMQTDNPWLTIDSNSRRVFIDMVNGRLRGFDNGALAEFDGYDYSPAMYFMLDKSGTKRKKVLYTENLAVDDTYKLLNGEISIAEASAFVDKYLSELAVSPCENSLALKTAAVNVVDIGKGYYGYNFIVVPEYNGMKFNFSYMAGHDANVKTISNDYDSRKYDTLPGTLNMIETDSVYYFLGIAPKFNVSEDSRETEIYTLESAAKMLSRFFSDSMSFNVRSVSGVYLPVESKVEPCWKFSIKNGTQVYNSFVNMLSGEIYVYIQER